MTTSLLAGLQDLHSLLLKLEGGQGEFDQGPKKIAAGKRVAVVKQQMVEASRKGLTQQRKKADEKSLQLKTNEAKIIELKGKLNTATSNREFDIFKGQIEADTMANSVLEDEILEAYELVDEATKELAKIEQELTDSEASVIDLEEKVAASRPNLENAITELNQQIKVAEEILPSDARQQYRRMAQAYGAKALAPVENKACTNCNTNVNSQDTVKLNVGKIVFCRSCGRLLYMGNT